MRVEGVLEVLRERGFTAFECEENGKRTYFLHRDIIANALVHPAIKIQTIARLDDYDLIFVEGVVPTSNDTTKIASIASNVSGQSLGDGKIAVFFTLHGRAHEVLHKLEKILEYSL